MRWNIVEIDGVAKMVVVLTHSEMSCLVVSMFDELLDRFRINIDDIKIFASVVCFNSALARKGVLPFFKSYNLLQ